MRLFRLVLRNALRNKRRTVLTVFSLMTSLFIFVFLRTIITSWVASTDEVPDASRRVIVRHRVSLANFLPEKYVERIRREVPGVEVVHPYHWVGGTVKDHEKEFFQQFACDADTFFETWTELKVTDEAKASWLADKAGALVGSKTLARFGLAPGSRFTLIGNIYPCDLELHVVGTYAGFSDDDTVFLHRSYLLESLRLRGITGMIYIKAKDASLIPRIIHDTDALFEDSEAPTRTETEHDFVQSFVSMMGNVKGFLMSLAATVIGAMLLIVVNTMSMAVRERTREIAVMKAIGFTPGDVVWLVVAESVLTCLAGGVLACTGARLLFDLVLHRPTILRMFPNFCPSWETVAIGVGISAAMGLVAALRPALAASRLQVVAGLRRAG